jgi:hypothetical protein
MSAFLLLNDLVVSFGFGYGIIGNVIRYLRTSKDIWENIREVSDITLTTIRGDEEKLSIQWILLPIGTFLIPYPIMFHKTKTVSLLKASYVKPYVLPIFVEDRANGETSVVPRFVLKYDKTKDELLRKQFTEEIVMKGISFVGDATTIEEETITAPERLTTVLETMKTTQDEMLHPFSLPVEMKTYHLNSGFLGNSVVSPDKQLAYRWDVINNRLPLSLTLLTLASGILFLSHRRYRKYSKKNILNIVPPIFTPKRYTMLFGRIREKIRSYM